MDMKEKLQELAEAARKRIEEAEGPDKLNEVKVAYLGKKGELTAILKSMKDVAPEDRPKVGQLVNCLLYTSQWSQTSGSSGRDPYSAGAS